ncbi:hypothetical protein Tco_1410940 [Tanacetum coccineum]
MHSPAPPPKTVTPPKQATPTKKNEGSTVHDHSSAAIKRSANKRLQNTASETRTQSSDAKSTTTANEVLGMDVNVSNKGSWNLPIQISIWSSTQQLGI